MSQTVAGYDIPVINERAVRAAAGILFLFGAIAFGGAIVTESQAPLQPFGMFFLIDMLLRVGVGARWSPSFIVGQFIVRKQQPEWVGYPQKVFAWWLGFGLAFISCTTMGFLGAPLAVTLVLCGVCLSLLFIETAFGICAGCSLQKLLTRTSPQYCAGDACAVPEHSHEGDSSAGAEHAEHPLPAHSTLADPTLAHPISEEKL